MFVIFRDTMHQKMLLTNSVAEVHNVFIFNILFMLECLHFVLGVTSIAGIGSWTTAALQWVIIVLVGDCWGSSRENCCFVNPLIKLRRSRYQAAGLCYQENGHSDIVCVRVHFDAVVVVECVHSQWQLMSTAGVCITLYLSKGAYSVEVLKDQFLHPTFMDVQEWWTRNWY